MLAALDKRKGSPGFPSSSFFQGQGRGGRGIRSDGARGAAIPDDCLLCRRMVIWRGNGILMEPGQGRSGTRGQNASAARQKTMPSASGKGEGETSSERQDLGAGEPARCGSWAAGERERTFGRRSKHEEGPKGRKERSGREHSGGAAAGMPQGHGHKKSPCSFLQGRNMVGHQGLEPRTN